MKAMMWVLCACVLSGATVLGEEKPQKKTLDIWMQQKLRLDNTVSYYMWVEGDTFLFEGSSANVYVGLDLGRSAYVSAKKLGNAMIFVKEYETPNAVGRQVKIVIGGSRGDDVTIYVPKGVKTSFAVDTFKERKEAPKKDE